MLLEELMPAACKYTSFQLTEKSTHELNSHIMMDY